MKPFMDVYKESLERSFKTWQLYAWQVGFEILRYVTIIPCLAVALWPLWKSRADFAGADFSKLSDAMFALMWTSGWWMVAAGMFLLYIVWWLIIEALVNGAVFGRLWAYEEKGELFVFAKYVREGFQYFLPLIGLNLLTSIVVFVTCALAGLFVAGAVLLLAGAGLPKWAGLLLAGLPAGLLLSILLVFVAAWWLIARGYVTSDHGVMESLKWSYRKCRENKGRVFRGINLLFVIVFAVLMGLGLVFGVLQYIPFIGVLFSIANFVISTLLAAFLAVYVPSVVVAFLGEKD
jgi:hypothetical protein